MRISSDTLYQRASIGEAGHDLSAVALTLSEPASSNHRWEIRLEAKGGNQAAARELGRVQTRAPASGGPHSRVLALASAPGATDWLVEVRHLSGTTPVDVEAELEIVGCAYPLDQSWQVVHGFDSSIGQRYRTFAGTLAAGANVVAIPTGVGVHTISAWTDSPAAATIGWIDPVTGAAVSVPLPAGGLTLGPHGSLWSDGSLSVVFTLPAGITGGYVIEGLV